MDEKNEITVPLTALARVALHSVHDPDMETVRKTLQVAGQALQEVAKQFPGSEVTLIADPPSAKWAQA